jgi:hypothetical protein
LQRLSIYKPAGDQRCPAYAEIESTSQKNADGTLHGDGPLLSVQRADLQISSLDDSFSFNAYEVPALTTFNLHPGYVDWPKEKKKYPHLADLDLPPVDFSKITILLGSDYQEALEP